MIAIRTPLPWKWIGLAALLVAEVGILTAIAISARGLPAEGLAAPAGSASIQASDQRNVVSALTVDRVTSPVAGWVVAQADEGSGDPGAVMGSAWIPAGESREVVIAIDPRRTLPARAFITLYADRGVVRTLELPASVSGGTSGTSAGAGMSGAESAGSDVPIIAGGGLVQAHPSVSTLTYNVGAGQASLSDTTRTVDATAVVVPRVVAPAQSWLVVSVPATSNQPAQLLGAKLVSKGTHANVLVPLDSPPGQKQIVATLHVDLGTLGRFEFSPLDLRNSPDQPYVAVGKAVSVPVVTVR